MYHYFSFIKFNPQNKFVDLPTVTFKSNERRTPTENVSVPTQRVDNIATRFILFGGMVCAAGRGPLLRLCALLELCAGRLVFVAGSWGGGVVGSFSL